MKVFISHAHTEKTLAAAWKKLLEDLGTQIETWYSSDQEGGIGMGKWRQKVEQELKECDLVLALFTPESKEKSWIHYECAYMLGRNKGKGVIPVSYYMPKSELASPLKDLQVFNGENKEAMKKLYDILVDQYQGNKVSDEFVGMAIDKYLVQVEEHSRARLAESLFHSHFHNEEEAKKMEGEWFARWTVFKGEDEEPFEIHPVKVWTTDNRIRIVGEGKDWADYYPMEGVVSSRGHIALSYWSQGEVPICGTCLLKLVGGNRIMKGTWEGYTAKTLKEELSLMRGNALLARDRKDLE